MLLMGNNRTEPNVTLYVCLNYLFFALVPSPKKFKLI